MKLNRPKLWHHLPSCIIDNILDNCEIDYDPYESSRVEVIDHLKNAGPELSFTRNYKNAQNYYGILTDESLIKIAQNNIESFKSQIENLEQFISKHE